MLNRRTYFIREHIGILKLTDAYDILDPATQEQIGIAKERVDTIFHILRLVVEKRLLPTKVFVYEGNNPEDESKLLFSIQRGFSFFRPKVTIYDRLGSVLGSLQSRLMTIGGAFDVYDNLGNAVAAVKGDWKGWNFRFLDKAENEIGRITKQWAGLGKELFTTADNYVIDFTQEPKAEQAIVLLAAGLAVDTVLKEK